MNKKRRPNSRKSRYKTKKQKFLSLRLQFPADDTRKTTHLSEMLPSTTSAADTSSHQLNLFPLHPENQVEDRENHDHENAAFYFSSADGGATSLTGLLDTNTAITCDSSHGTNNISSRNDDLSPSSVSLTYAYGGQDSESGEALVRNAMRNRERISGEEKWVCYSEVVERKLKEEEVTSSAVDPPRAYRDPAGIQPLSLKLDYQEILNAWCDKGPLYVHAESSQIVPDINDEFLSHEASNNGTSWGCTAGLWTVPTMVKNTDHNVEIKVKNGDHELMIGQREASVLRYKEKRQNRLFSKQIRYEVRKLNAQKRPRLKGRFVKRS